MLLSGRLPLIKIANIKNYDPTIFFAIFVYAITEMVFFRLK